MVSQFDFFFILIKSLNFKVGARLILVLTPHISGHLMKPIIYTVVFTGAVRNVKSSKYGKNEPKTAKSVIFL